MSSGVEIEDGRVPVLFEKGPELLIIGTEGSVPVGQHTLGLGNVSQSSDWNSNNEPGQVLSDTACNLPHITSMEVVGHVAGDHGVNCDGLDVFTAEDAANTNWFPVENEQQEPVYEREASQTCGSEAKESNVIPFACFDSMKESPLSTDLFEHCNVGTSEQLSLSSEWLSESGDASGNSIGWSGSLSHGHELHQNEEGKASLASTASIILGSENGHSISESFVASVQLNSVNTMLLSSSSSQEFFQKFDQTLGVPTLNIGSKPSIVGFKESERVDDSPCLLLPNEKQKGAILEAEEAHTPDILKNPFNLTSNSGLGVAVRSLEPVLSTTDPIDTSSKHSPLLASEHDGCISCELGAHANSLVVGNEGMTNMVKEPRVVASQSSLLPWAEREDVVGEFSAVGDSIIFNSDYQKAPAAEDEQLQALADIVEAQTDSIDRMDYAGEPCYLAESDPPGICVLDGQDAQTHELLAIVNEETPVKNAEGGPCNFTSCVVSYNSRSPLASPASVSPSNFSPCEQNGVETEFPAVGVKRFEMSIMEEQKCSFDVTFSNLEEASAASFESSQVADDVLQPISSSSIQLITLACDENKENGTKSLTIRSDGKNSLEPGESAHLFGLDHEDYEKVSVLESESPRVTFQKICAETTPETSDVLLPSFNNEKQVVEAFRNNTNSPMTEGEQVGTVTDFLLLEEKRTRMLNGEQSFYCSEGVSSCSILEDPVDTLSVGSTHPRHSPRLTRMRNAARQCWKTLEAIAVSLGNSRKKRSSFAKRARNSTWGALHTIVEVFSQEGKIIDSNYAKAPKNSWRKERGGLGERRRQKKTRTKGCSHASKNKQRNSTKKIRLKFNIGEQMVLPILPGHVDLSASIQSVLNDVSPQLESFTEGLKFDNKLETSLDCSPEKLLGELSRDKDLESSVTQETSLENYFGEFHGVSPQMETQTSTEAFYNKDLDAGTSPDSDGFRKISGLTEIKSAISSVSETANQSDTSMWPSLNLDVCHLVQVPDAVERENGGDEGESREISGNCMLIDSQAVVPLEAVVPSNVLQNRKKKESQNEKINNVQYLPSIEKGLIGSENIRTGRIQSRYRRQRKAVGKLENKKQETGACGSESKSSNSGVLRLESPINRMAELEICQEVSIVDAGPDSLGLPVQDDPVKALAASRVSIGGHTKEINPCSDLTSPVGKNTARQKKGSREKATKKKGKKYITGRDVLKEDNTLDLCTSTDCKSDSERVGNEVINDNIFFSKMLPVGGERELEIKPRAAWVRCDDCYKWRCISAEWADEIEETNCRWTCKENADKHFADCSIPQEKSNAEINAELEISDASGDEDYRCQQPSFKQFESRNQLVAQQAPWTLIKHNIFLHRSPKTQTIDEVMVCHCKPPSDGSLGCGDECLNRMLNIECVQGTCPCGDLCSNQQFQKHKYAKLKWFRSGKKGYGLQLLEDISRGNFLIEYVGEVLDLHNYEARQRDYGSRGQKHFYFMTLNGSEVIDACAKGNLGRFINHSCEPNCRTEKWMVNGEVCIGLFALRDIKKGEEVTFDYNYVRVFGAAAKKCHCGSSECQGYIGGDPSNTEAIVHVDSDDEYPEPVMLNEAAEAGLNVSETNPPQEDSGEKLDSTVGCVPSSDMQKLVNSRQKTDNVNGLHADVQQLHVSLPLRGKNFSKPIVPGEKSEIPLQVEYKGRLSLPSKEMDRISSPTAEPSILLQKENVLDETSDASEPPEIVLLKTMKESASVEDVCKPIQYTVENKSETVKTSTYVKSSKSSSIKKGKISATKFLSYKTKRPLEGSSSGRFEGVEEKLNELLDAHGGISKRKDATKGYLKLLFVTAASGDNIKGEISQSTRDLSIVLDALLKTKSRSVLADIINKNGLQMLHNIMKQNRRNFNKIPIIRKLLKVIEYLGVKEILTFEHVNIPPPCAAMESFKESILVLTRHNDIQVHQIARHFRDRWFPRNIRKVYSDRDESRLDKHNHFHLSQKRWHDQGARPSDAIQCIGTTNHGITVISTSEPEHSSAAQNASGSHELCTVAVSNPSDGTKRTRKRKSRWDQPEETNPAQPPETVDAQVADRSPHCEMSMKQPAVCVGVENQVSSVETDAVSHHVGDGPDAPPGFSTSVTDSSNMSLNICPSTVVGQPLPRYLGHLPVSYGIPWTQVQEFGITKKEGGDQWEIAPGVPFHPFPPLPTYPREATGFGEEIQGPQRCCSMASQDVLHCGANNINGNERVRWSSGDGLGRRYFKQQKWNNNWGNRLPPPWARRRGWGFKGNNNRNHMRNCLNSVVSVEDVRNECSGDSSKESVNGNSGGSGGPHCFRDDPDKNSSCSVDSVNTAALCQQSEVHCHQ